MVGIDIELVSHSMCKSIGYFNQFFYRKCLLGLMLNDVYENTPEVEEAVQRLPSDVFDARNKRIAMAFHLSLNKMYLPKEQWTKYEEDVKYLEPYLEEVKREKAEKEGYEHNNFETSH